MFESLRKQPESTNALETTKMSRISNGLVKGIAGIAALIGSAQMLGCATGSGDGKATQGETPLSKTETGEIMNGQRVEKGRNSIDRQDINEFNAKLSAANRLKQSVSKWIPSSK